MILDRAFAVLGPEYGAVFLLGPSGELTRAAERRSPGASGTLLISRRLADEVTVRARPRSSSTPSSTSGSPPKA